MVPFVLQQCKEYKLFFKIERREKEKNNEFQFKEGLAISVSR